MFLPQEIIRKKRDGQTLSTDEIQGFVVALANSEMSEGQAAAFAMAVYFNGMTRDECVDLTQAMRDSGRVLDWREYGVEAPVVDKHSTGGVGDNVSLMLAPMLAACGAAVPMISGRGLGHTGGTLDKLDSIPGYQSQPSFEKFVKTVKHIGCAIIGQTEDLAPADRRLYAIRDVTATVESIPLITASILSKKLAAGLDVLVLDVKTGSGAFMEAKDDAKTLASNLVQVATRAGVRTSALITAMDQPLASVAGNAIEVVNALDYLTGRRRDERLHRVVMALGCETLTQCGVAGTQVEANDALENALTSGKAAEKFAEMASALGADKDLLDQYPKTLPTAPIVRPVVAGEAGVVKSINTRELGLAVLNLGGGRTRADQSIDAAVGLSDLAPVGRRIDNHTPLGRIHARDESAFKHAAAQLKSAYHLDEGDEPVAGDDAVIFDVIRA